MRPPQELEGGHGKDPAPLVIQYCQVMNFFQIHTHPVETATISLSCCSDWDFIGNKLDCPFVSFFRRSLSSRVEAWAFAHMRDPPPAYSSPAFTTTYQRSHFFTHIQYK
jgi:hypothetical protein